MRISDWSSDVCSSDLSVVCRAGAPPLHRRASCRLAQAQGDRVVTRRRYAVATLLTCALFTVLFAVVAFRPPRPRVPCAATASAPIGLSRLTPLSHPPVGALVAITPPAHLAPFLSRRPPPSYGAP